jgi:lactoylglutathione lyase
MGVRAIGINHVAFEVDDLDQALQWYGRYFDFTLRGRHPTMAWVDLGDQFLALSQRPEGSEPSPDRARHVGFVVADKEALREALKAGGEEVNPSGSLRVRDPSGNQLEIVDYRDIQFSKTPAVLGGMGLADLAKNPSAVQELRDKGLG